MTDWIEDIDISTTVWSDDIDPPFTVIWNND